MCAFFILLHLWIVADVSLLFVFIFFNIILLESDICYCPSERPIDLFTRLELTQSSFPDKHIARALTGRVILPLFLLWLRTPARDRGPVGELMASRHSKQLPDNKTGDERGNNLQLKSRSI